MPKEQDFSKNILNTLVEIQDRQGYYPEEDIVSLRRLYSIEERRGKICVTKETDDDVVIYPATGPEGKKCLKQLTTKLESLQDKDKDQK